MCLSKGLTGGFLPLAAVLATQSIYDGFLDDSRERAFLHSHSYTGNPLACAAALASLAIFETDDVLARNRATAARMSALAAAVRVASPRGRRPPGGHDRRVRAHARRRQAHAVRTLAARGPARLSCRARTRRGAAPARRHRSTGCRRTASTKISLSLLAAVDASGHRRGHGMRVNRFFVDQPLRTGADVRLPEAAATHLVRVLRGAVGDACVLFNGDGPTTPRASSPSASAMRVSRSPASTSRPTNRRCAITLAAGAGARRKDGPRSCRRRPNSAWPASCRSPASAAKSGWMASASTSASPTGATS